MEEKGDEGKLELQGKDPCCETNLSESVNERIERWLIQHVRVKECKKGVEAGETDAKMQSKCLWNFGKTYISG
jgi:hypothetical protein